MVNWLRSIWRRWFGKRKPLVSNMQKIPISVKLNREELFELGRRPPKDIVDRFTNFPVSLKGEIKCKKPDSDC